MAKILTKRGALAGAAGLAAGFLNGLLGTGGGIILIYAFRKLSGGSAGAKDAMASALASALPMSALSAFLYMRGGAFNPAGNWIFLPAGIVGGIAGALLLDRLKAGWVRLLFAGMLIVAGGLLLFR